MMHELLIKVLEDRELSKAGQLFNISDWDIVADLHTALAKLKEISNSDTYALDLNSQSVVEICLARITSAIRETNSIETYAPGLVDMLESCLSHNLTPVFISTNSVGREEDTPHSKLASDLLSCLFLHYGSKSVMTVSIPVAAKILQKGNKDLIRNTSSYLSLAAIQNARLLSQYALQIISSIKSGNYSLVRVLPQVYPENKEPFHAHLSSLVSVLHECDPAEKLSLLQLFSMVASCKPEILVCHVTSLRSCLISHNTCTAVLNIYLTLVTNGQAASLIGQIVTMRKAAEGKISSSNTASMAKITGAVGVLSKESAQEAMQNLILLCRKVDSCAQVIILKEIERIAESYPFCVQPYLETIAGLAENGPVKSAYIRIRDLCSDDQTLRNSLKNLSSNEKITVIPIANSITPTPEISNKSLSTVSPSHTTVTVKSAVASGTTTTFAITGRAIPSYTPTSRNSPLSVNSSKSNLSKPKSRSYANLISSSRRQLAASGGSPSPSYNRTLVPVPNGPRISPLDPTFQYRSGHITPLSTAYNRPPPPYVPTFKTPPAAIVFGNSAGFLPTLQMDVKGRIRPNPHRPTNPWLPMQTANQDSSGSHVVTTFSVQPDTITQRTGSGSTLIIEEQQPISSNPDPKPSSPQLGTVVNVGEPTMLTVNHTPMQNNNYTPPPVMQKRPVCHDAVKQFCQKHRKKIRDFMADIIVRYPVPQQCTVEESGHKHRMRVYFACQEKGEHCLYTENLFAFKTRLPSLWIHLMFLHLQAQQTGDMLGQASEQVKKLKNCWECLPGFITKDNSFAALVTSAFPAIKDQQQLLKDLQSSHYFDSFAYNAANTKWTCFACNHPDKVKNFLKQEPNNPVLEGQLKEKRGRWKFFKRWQTKYFTLSSAALSYRDEFCDAPRYESASLSCRTAPAIDLRSIRSVKSISRRKSRKNLPRAFEIFTNDDTSYVLKAKDRTNAEEWFQCLQIAVAQAQREIIVSQL